MNILACPYCGQRAVSVYKKLLPQLPRKCQHCRRHIQQSSRAFGVLLAIPFAVIFIAMLAANRGFDQFPWLLLVILYVPCIPISYFLRPIVKPRM